MKLTEISISDFRSFGGKQTIHLDNETLFIGKNSTGKTTILAAISKIFSPSSSQRVLRRSDFHISRFEDPEMINQKNLQIEVVFSLGKLTSQEDLNAGAYFFPGVYVDSDSDDVMLRIRLDASWLRSANPEGSVESSINYVTCPLDTEPEERDLVRASRSELDAIRLIYIPAIRNPDEQLRGTSSGLLQTILSSYKMNDTDKEQLQESANSINQQLLGLEGIGALSEEICSGWEVYDPDSRYNKAMLEFYDTDLGKLLRKPNLIFLPSITEKPFETNEIGDGLRSLLYFSLVESMLRFENRIRLKIDTSRTEQTNPENLRFEYEPPSFTILAVEEPENHISPHLLGKLMASLSHLANEEYAQVLVTSHSPSIAKRVSPESIRHLLLDRTSLETLCRPILLPEKRDEAYKFIKGAVHSYPELYFADLVILGEGASEELIIPKVLSALGIGTDKAGISVVPLGGRHVNHLWKLLYDLEIPCITLLDLDWGRDRGGWRQIAYVIEQLVKNGTPVSEFKQIDNTSLTMNAIKTMKNYGYDHKDELGYWIAQLEKHKVFFSSPLDIDFMMIKHFPKEYKKIAGNGPRINGVGIIADIEESDPDNDAYLARVLDSVQVVLHKNGDDGSRYSEDDKRLMVWYKYLFIDNGKPATHVLALETIDEETLGKNVPDVLRKIAQCADEMVGEQNA